MITILRQSSLSNSQQVSSPLSSPTSVTWIGNVGGTRAEETLWIADSSILIKIPSWKDICTTEQRTKDIQIDGHSFSNAFTYDEIPRVNELSLDEIEHEIRVEQAQRVIASIWPFLTTLDCGDGRVQNVLDVGCGTGEFGFVLQKRQYNQCAFRMVAIEPDQELVDIGESFSDDDNNNNNIHSSKLQQLSLQQYRGFFDVITILGFLVPYDEQDSFFQHLCQLVNPEHGLVIIGVFDRFFTNPQHPMYLPLAYERYLETVETVVPTFPEDFNKLYYITRKRR